MMIWMLCDPFQGLFAEAFTYRQISCDSRGISHQSNHLYATKSNSPVDGKSNQMSNESEQKSKGLTIGGLVQLVLMGAGAPGLGEYKGTDPTTGKMMFELEANNLVNSKGEDIQTKAKFFKEGWVEGSDESIEKPPGFFENLISGGRLQEEWDKKNRKAK